MKQLNNETIKQLLSAILMFELRWNWKKVKQETSSIFLSISTSFIYPSLLSSFLPSLACFLKARSLKAKEAIETLGPMRGKKEIWNLHAVGTISFLLMMLSFFSGDKTINRQFDLQTTQIVKQSSKEITVSVDWVNIDSLLLWKQESKIACQAISCKQHNSDMALIFIGLSRWITNGH